MSNPYSAPWSVSERMELLTNMLQAAVPDPSSFLFQVLVEHNIQPKWDDMALPRGRSVHACQAEYDLMWRARPGRSFSSVGPMAYGPPAMAPNLPQKRTVSEQEPHATLPRPIQPRPARSTDSPIPPATNGESFSVVRPYVPELAVEKRKKRGRPTKEEAEERDRALAAEGRFYEPKKRPSKKLRTSAGGASVPRSEAETATPPGLHTPGAQAPETKEESSSGKRRSKRQRDEAEPTSQLPPTSPVDESGATVDTEAAQSPSDRLLARSKERSRERDPRTVSSLARESHDPPAPAEDPST